MSVRGRSATGPTALKTNIRAVERRIRHRRASIGVAFRSMADNVANQLTSPSTLIAAGLFGAALHRSPQLNALRLLAILRTANAGLRRLLTATSRIRVPVD